jgi:integrase
LEFAADIEMVANFWLRSGDAHTANNFQAFLEKTLSFFQEKNRIVAFGFGLFSGKIFDYPEEEGRKTDYITAVPMYVLKKYAALARIVNLGLIPDRIRPHNLRTSRAMHWLQAGIEIYHIRDLLGPVSVQTTEIYARTDSKSKREALEKAYAAVGITEPEITSWEKNPKLVEFLKSLA